MGGTVFSGAEGQQGFVDNGILVPVWFVPATGRGRGVRVLALVDTGSTICSIDVGVAGLLRAATVGSSPVGEFGGTVSAPIYAGNLVTDGGVVLTQGQVLGAKLSAPAIRNWKGLLRQVRAGMMLALIGRQALTGLTLRVQGGSGAWSAVAAS